MSAASTATLPGAAQASGGAAAGVAAAADAAAVRPMRIGGVALPTNLVMAPMAGLTDRIFRMLVRRRAGCGLAFTEMVSSEALTRGIRNAFETMDLSLDPRPVGVQLYGARSERMADSALMAEEAGADIIDINMGCPAAKIVRNGAGAALLRDLAAVEKIVAAVVGAVRVPVTVKLRLGWSDSEINVADAARACEAAGAAAVTVHCRTRGDGFRGQVRWGALSEVTETLGIPVLVNGDIRNAADAREAAAASGALGVMVGREALRNPFVFEQIRGTLPPGDVPTALRRAFILEHFRLIVEHSRSETCAVHFMRVFAGWYTRGLMYGSRLRRAISGIRSPDGFFAAIEEHFDGGAEVEQP